MGFGLIVIVLGLLLRFVLVPGLKQFPDDVDETRHYALEYLILLDADTLQFYRSAPAQNPDLRIDRRVIVEDVDGGRMLAREEQTIYDGDEVIRGRVLYHALDRRSLEFLDDVPDDWASRDGYWQRAGLVIGWGLDTERQDYTGWADDYRATVPLVYAGEQVHAAVAQRR